MLDGEDITDLAEDDLARVRGRKIGFVFQSYQLIPTLTAEENVLLPAELSNLDNGGIARARELLKRVGLALVLVTHDRGLAAHADRVVMLKDGRVVSDGKP